LDKWRNSQFRQLKWRNSSCSKWQAPQVIPPRSTLLWHLPSAHIPLQNSKRNSISGALNIRGGNVWFRPQSPFISETARWINGSLICYRLWSIRVRSEDPEWIWKMGCEGTYLLLRSYVYPRRTKFGTVTLVGEGMFLVQPRTHPKGRAPASQKLFGTSCMRAHGMRI